MQDLPLGYSRIFLGLSQKHGEVGYGTVFRKNRKEQKLQHENLSADQIADHYRQAESGKQRQRTGIRLHAGGEPDAAARCADPFGEGRLGGAERKNTHGCSSVVAEHSGTAEIQGAHRHARL